MSVLVFFLVISIFIFTFTNQVQSFKTTSGSFIHLTDIHYDPQYTVGAPTNCLLESTGIGCCRPQSIPLNPPGSASPWGDFNCDSPLLLINSTIQWILKNLQYDFVIYTGDSVNHDDIQQTWNSNFQAIETVTENLKTLNRPIYNVLGNHDSWFVNQLYTNVPVVTDTATLFQNNSLTNYANISNFETGGFYIAHHDFFNISMCGLNSLWYDASNLGVEMFPHYDWGQQYEWMQNHSDMINTQCLLFAHIPPQCSGTSVNFTQFMTTLFSPPVQIYGHTHQDEFKLLHNFQTGQLNLALITPSLVPSNHNPGFRHYFFEIEQGHVKLLDYDQYTLNLTRQIENQKEFIGFTKLYSALEYFNLQDMSSNSWLQLVKNMQNNVSMFEQYCTVYSFPESNMSNCNRTEMLCDILNDLC